MNINCYHVYIYIMPPFLPAFLLNNIVLNAEWADVVDMTWNLLPMTWLCLALHASIGHMRKDHSQVDILRETGKVDRKRRNVEK